MGLASETNNHRWTHRLAVLGCVLGLFAALFGAALFQSNTFLFRDAAHFYHPLFKLIQAEFNQGRFPLWNPYENSGEPLLGNPTAHPWKQRALALTAAGGYLIVTWMAGMLGSSAEAGGWMSALAVWAPEAAFLGLAVHFVYGKMDG